MKIIDEVMTTAEAAERWGISAITVKQACSGQKGAPASFQRRRGVPQVRPHMADNEGRHGAPVWERKRIAGRKVGRSWRPESPLNENGTA